MKKVNSDQSIDHVDVVVTPKVVKPPDPDMGEFAALTERARKQAKEARLKQADITSAIARARSVKTKTALNID